ncbi:MAG: hypothetical protein ABW067_03140 [Rhizobacter sp.]
MGVLQYLFAVAFLICYALIIGDFFGPGARGGVALVGLVSAVGFSFFTTPWVHGVLLTAFAVIGIGLFLGVAWLLKTLFASAVGEVSVEAAYDDAVAAETEHDPREQPVLPARAAPEPITPELVSLAEPVPEPALGRLLRAEGPALDQRPS